MYIALRKLSSLSSPGARLFTRHWAGVVCLIALIFMAVNMVSAVWRKSLTNDEVMHIPSGYFYLTERNFRLNAEHPPLAKIWSAVPLVFMKLKRPVNGNGAQTDFQNYTMASAGEFWETNQDRFQSISYWARVPPIILTLSLGVLIFIYSKQCFGPRAAALSVALFSFEPTMLAHGRIVHTDVPAALGYLSFFFALHSYWRHPGLRRALILGVVTGLALVMKFSMIALVPILFVALAFLFYRARRRNFSRGRIAIHSGVTVLIAVLVVNAAYGFQHSVLAAPDAGWVEATSPLLFRHWSAVFKTLSRVFPACFMLGLHTTMLHNKLGHPASLLGQYSLTGWWYYFPVAFALKTSLPFLIVSVSALMWALWRLIAKREKVFLVFVIAIAIYTALSMTSNINIGIRHFLPVFPFLFILGGALLDRIMRSRQSRVLAFVAALTVLGWAGVEAWRTYADYTPYMNQMARQHPRWYYLSDSNVEWGDDVSDLAHYLQARGETSVRAALAGGWATLGYYDVQYVDLLPSPGKQFPPSRYVAIGAGFLNGSTVPRNLRDADGNPISEQQRVNWFAPYRNRTPEAVFGNSIYLYREN
jgi:hypothetical protein